MITLTNKTMSWYPLLCYSIMV